MDVAEKFWDDSFSQYTPVQINKEEFYQDNKYFLDTIKDVEGKRLLDLGCGNGEISIYFANKGALVTAIDLSEAAVSNTLKSAELNKVEVDARKLNAMEIEKLDKKFDLVVGKLILHHIEPFGEFVDILFDVLDEGGRGMFYENNARNKVLMFFRNTIVGRFGVPKYGDDLEYPFEYKELKMIKNKFSKVILTYPQFRFFSLLAPYIFKDNVTSDKVTRAMDRFVYKNLSFFNKYSYIQILDFQK